MEGLGRVAGKGTGLETLGFTPILFSSGSGAFCWFETERGANAVAGQGEFQNSLALDTRGTPVEEDVIWLTP